MSKTICVDYGHGGGSGARNGNIIEDNLINVTGDECVRILKDSGFKVVQTRTTNTNVSFNTRTTISNDNKADFLISIHYNAGGGEGFECIRSLRESVVSVAIANNIIKRLPSINHVKRPRTIYTRAGSSGKDYFAILRGSKCPALILEGAFIDNAKDINRINTDSKLKAIGRIYAEAIIEYYGGVAKIPTPIQPKPEVVKPQVQVENQRDGDLYHIIGTVDIDINSVLSIREYPDINSKIVDTKLNGDIVNLLHPVNKEWWAISYDNDKSRGVAFVQKKYLKTK